MSARPPIVAVMTALLLAGCGGGNGDEAKRAPASPPREAAGPPPDTLQNASCSHWNSVGDQGRRTLLGMLAASRGAPVVGKGVRAQGTVLTEEQATRLFNERCSLARSEQLRLYKLYAFAADFVGRAPAR